MIANTRKTLDYGLPLVRRKTARQITAPLNALEWATAYRRIDDQPFTLDRHKPLQAIYLDDHPHIIVMKPAQVGVSELAITKAMHALDCGAAYWQTGKAGLNVGYLFPTATALGDFSKERITGLQEESDHIRDMFAGGYDDVRFKQIGASYLYLRGAQSKKALKSFPADCLFYDEYDEMDAGALALAEKRLRASVVKRQMKLSTPTIPGRGIHAAYLLSDQHEWHVQCDQCDASVVLDFFRDVTANGAHYHDWHEWPRTQLARAVYAVECPHCHTALDRCGDGEWIAGNPDSDLRGYHVPSLCFPMVSLKDIALALTSDDPTQVTEAYRSDLGLPYDAAGSGITDTMLDALASDELPTGGYTSTCMGIDVGTRFHYLVSSLCDGERVIRDAGAVKSWDELDALMRRYKVRMAAIDVGPELHGAEAWSAKHAGKVYRARYNIHLPTLHDRLGEAKPGAKKKPGDVVQINRTAVLDAVYARVSSVTDVWMPDVARNAELRSHLKAPTRIEVVTKSGDVRADWVHTSPDHLYHALAYLTIAEALCPKAAPAQAFLGVGVNGW